MYKLPLNGPEDPVPRPTSNDQRPTPTAQRHHATAAVARQQSRVSKREAGHKTARLSIYQSAQFHYSSVDGGLWLRAPTVLDQRVRVVLRRVARGAAAFGHGVYRLVHPPAGRGPVQSPGPVRVPQIDHRAVGAKDTFAAAGGHGGGPVIVAMVEVREAGTVPSGLGLGPGYTGKRESAMCWPSHSAINGCLASILCGASRALHALSVNQTQSSTHPLPFGVCSGVAIPASHFPTMCVAYPASFSFCATPVMFRGMP